jgi:hypothetical protein
VNGNGAYWGEMNEVVAFEKALRAAVPSRVDPGLDAELVPRLAQAARSSTLEMEGRVTRRGEARPNGGPGLRPRAWMARIGVTIVALPLLLAGLAFAGVTMPSPVRSAFDSAGVHLPNQPSPSHAAKTTPASTQNSSQREPTTSPDRSRSHRGKAEHARNQSSSGKPGRRVRRHGNGPVPGPASPAQGKALGLVKPHGNSQDSSRGSGPPASPGSSGSAPRHTGAQGGSGANGHQSG